MIENDADIGSIKAEVLYEVAKLAFEDKLKEMEEEIPFSIIPGPKANFRCCVYREREIIRERVRLAQGKTPCGNKDDKNIVQVIRSACEGCPITRFVVTNNCQKCMSRKCQAACSFGAITIDGDKARIDPDKCRECGKCAQACPYNAIADIMRPCKRSCPVDAITMDDNSIVKINKEKCISCGACISDCPFGAISDRSFLTDVINLLKAGVPVYAMTAPAVEGQFGPDVTISDLSEMICEMGFAGNFEVALGGDLVAASEAEEWSEAYREGKKMTTSCCPAFVNMVKKHFPSVMDSISTTVSPMAATSRLIKAMNPDAVTVFIGPCIAKKSEVIETVADNTADYALTFEELHAMFRAKQISIAPRGTDMQQGSIFGKRFAASGGVTGAVVEALKEAGENAEINVKQCNGALECKKALTLLKAGRLPEDFIEGMACEGGCVSGPGNIRGAVKAKKDREALLSKADGRGIRENMQEYEKYRFSMHRKK